MSGDHKCRIIAPSGKMFCVDCNGKISFQCYCDSKNYDDGSWWKLGEGFIPPYVFLVNLKNNQRFFANADRNDFNMYPGGAIPYEDQLFRITPVSTPGAVQLANFYQDKTIAVKCDKFCFDNAGPETFFQLKWDRIPPCN